MINKHYDIQSNEIFEIKNFKENPCKHRKMDNKGVRYCKLATEKMTNGIKAEVTEQLCSWCMAAGEGNPSSKVINTITHINKTEHNKQTVNKAEFKLGEGPGTELHKMIPSWLERPNCSCRSFAKKMNIWGVEGCEKHIETIVDKLTEESKKRALLSWVPKSMTRMVSYKMAQTAINRSREKEGSLKQDWFVAVTTAPRRDPTLQVCMDSLMINDWRPYVFAEPGNYSFIGEEYKQNFILNDTKKGVWWNWVDSCKYALENSNAKIIMTVQDDSLFHPDSRIMTEKFLWPSSDVGFISLYTPKHYSIKNHLKSKPERPLGLNKIVTKALWGACALVWPREVLEMVMKHELIEGWLGAPLKTKSAWAERQKERKKKPWTIQNSDTGIGKIMNRMGRSMWFMDPSPVQHFAEHSAINHGDNKGRRNCGRCAKFSLPLDEQVDFAVNGVPPTNLVKTEDIIINKDNV